MLFSEENEVGARALESFWRFEERKETHSSLRMRNAVSFLETAECRKLQKEERRMGELKES